MGNFKYEDEYREKYKDAELEDIIIFRSGPMADTYIPGMDYDDNARALFEYALSAGFDKKYKLVWIVKDPSEWADKFSTHENVLFLSWEDADSDDVAKRDNFFHYLCLAKYLFMTDSYGFALGSRPDQVRVMLWHGCGFKTRLGFKPNEHNYEYMTVTGDEYARTYAKVFGLREDQMLVTGYPKVDYIFHPDNDWQKKLNVKPADRYVFWLPTFRNTNKPGLERHDHTKPKGETGLPVVASLEEMRSINNLLRKKDAVMIIKLHPFQDRNMICDMSEFSNIQLIENESLLQADIQINQILGYADALLSDYSSVSVDYLVLDRPVGFTLDDVESYERERGFFWPDVKPHLPGKEIYGFEELYAFISDSLEGLDPGAEKRHSICDEMQKFKDDHNSERVFKVLGIEV
ncbi:MAG: CDP-glycerol glycerophosphotransferase family protein [Lachnospiraceae bacterium]|nr:CDP-glycerol glycerophosphotransferase family protein [Lachnospiraceae bacterium]